MQQLTVERLEKCLFTTSLPNEPVHRFVMVVDKKHAVTYQHGQHSLLIKEKDIILIYNVVNPELSIQVTVLAISAKYDCVVLKAINDGFPHFLYGFSSVYLGEEYFQIGISEKRKPIWRSGAVSKVFTYYYSGTSHKGDNDCGSCLFNMDGYFIECSVPQKEFLSLSELSIKEVANHSREIMILSFESVMSNFDVDEDPTFCPT